MEEKITSRKTGLVTLDTGDPDFYILFCGFRVSVLVLLWSKFWIQQGVSSEVIIPAIFYGQLPAGGIQFSQVSLSAGKSCSEQDGILFLPVIVWKCI